MAELFLTDPWVMGNYIGLELADLIANSYSAPDMPVSDDELKATFAPIQKKKRYFQAKFVP